MYSTQGKIQCNDKGKAQSGTPGRAVRSIDGIAGRQLQSATILQRAQLDPGSLTSGDMLRLQRAIGNQAVCQLMAGLNPIQAQPEKEEDEEPVELMKAPVQMQDDVLKPEDEEEPVQGMFAPVQMRENILKPNNTGMPDHLKTGVENLSGISMDDVRVHYNSEKPTGLGALAYTQGTDIHVAPGQERHLAHEAWHVVQQKEGRVEPTGDIGGIPLNDNGLLETEADVMGGKALHSKKESSKQDINHHIIQRKLHYKIFERKENQPVVGEGLTKLGVRENEVKIEKDRIVKGTVDGIPQGMSVSDSYEEETGRGVSKRSEGIFVIKDNNFENKLKVRLDPTEKSHYLVGPKTPMTYEKLNTSVQNSVDKWVLTGKQVEGQWKKTGFNI